MPSIPPTTTRRNRGGGRLPCSCPPRRPTSAPYIRNYKWIFSLPVNNDQTIAHINAELQNAHQLLATGRRDEAISGLRKLSKSNAGGPFWANIAQLQMQAADLDGALVSARKFVSTCPGNVQAKSLLANVLADIGCLDEAVPLAQEVAKHFPQLPVAHFSLGLFMARHGEIEGARQSFARALSLQPHHALALEYLAYLTQDKAADSLMAQIDAAIQLQRAGQNRHDHAALHYARARLLEREEQWDEAFDSYEAGAGIMRSASKQNLPAMERYVGRLKESFSAQFFSDNAARRHGNPRPIFIVGIPRSGTTLLESVLAAHSKVSAGGETTQLGVVTAAYKSFEPPDLARIETAIAAGENPWSSLGQALRQIHNDRYGARGRVTEKNLGQHFFLGVVAMIAAGARIIYCERDPVASAWSCFKTRFTRGNGWSYDFPSIAHYQRLYRDIMTHWNEVLPDAPILNVAYEDLVSRPAEIVPTILEHANLEFQEACLEPHKSNMAVMTASLTEVRKPIYKDANMAWKHYESRISPYLDELRSG